MYILKDFHSKFSLEYSILESIQIINIIINNKFSRYFPNRI
jgi:hypothetical protein